MVFVFACKLYPLAFNSFATVDDVGTGEDHAEAPAAEICDAARHKAACSWYVLRPSISRATAPRLSEAGVPTP